MYDVSDNGIIRLGEMSY